MKSQFEKWAVEAGHLHPQQLQTENGVYVYHATTLAWEAWQAGAGCLNLDTSPDEARALHRVVRAMHDGNCPNCGFLAKSLALGTDGYACPNCRFRVTRAEAERALAEFLPYQQKAIAIFNAWREISVEQVVDALLMVFGPCNTDQAVIASWSQATRVEVLAYANAVERCASDNPVKVPPQPEALRRLLDV